MTDIKPLIKWVGGKTQILPQIFSVWPNRFPINNYHEIFVGGGSVLLAFLSKCKKGEYTLNGNIYAYDINPSLINMYKNIQTNPDALYETIQTYINTMRECDNVLPVNRSPQNEEEATKHPENYYYWLRSTYNSLSSEEKQSIKESALFIFLNKTCFRGLYREGPNGFNVPYGHYKNPEIINKEHLYEIRRLIAPVIFECKSFEETLQLSNMEPNDYVYMDPPYAPITSTSFDKYTEKGFPLESHNTLFACIDALTKKKICVLLSNADVSLVRDHFTKKKGYLTQSITCKRTINSKNPESKAQEVLITNYK